MAKTEFALKIHTYTTRSGFEPATGVGSADFRGDKWVGHEQGDEHHCVFALKSLDSLVVDELLQVLPSVNAAILKGEEAAVGELGVIYQLGAQLSNFGPIPSVRFGIWDNDK